MEGGSTPTSSTRWASSWPRYASPAEARAAAAYLEERFGIPPLALSGYRFLRTGRTVYLLSEGGPPERISDLRIQSAGIPVLRRVAGRLKPTSHGLQLLGPFITKGAADVDRDELERLSAGEWIEKDPGVSPGYVAVRFEGRVVACGVFLEGKGLALRAPRWLMALLREGLSRLPGRAST